MKALTLTQPYATLIAIGAKRIETRSWGTSYRGPLAIHAAKTFPGWAKDTCESEAIFRRALGWPNPPNPLTQAWMNSIAQGMKALPLGCVLATCRLVDCKQISASLLGLPHPPAWTEPPPEPELSFGDYEPGRYAWILDNVQALPVPISAKGSLGLWEWDQRPEG